MGNNRLTFLCIVGLVALQICMAAFVRDSALWVGVALGVFVGVVPSLGLYFLMHECSHQLVFRGRGLNVLTGILANSVNAIPYAVQYTDHHLNHHSRLGNRQVDPDMPAAWEARLVGHSGVRKCLWLLLNPLFQLLRATRVGSTRGPRGWLALTRLLHILTQR
jgi:sphingolipid delta-4 desaturase